MALDCIAIMTPGDMGHAIGRRLAKGGLRVVTNLQGRSARSRALAEKAGIEDLGSDASLLAECDAIFSIMPPDQAGGFVDRMAKAAGTLTENPRAALVDLNAIAPSTARALRDKAEAAGIRFLDGGIIGGPPYPGRPSPRVYVNGPGAEAFEALGPALDIHVVAGEVGAASALKMCFATLTKGVQALAIQSFVTAELEGVGPEFRAEMEGAQANLLKSLSNSLPGMPPKAYRWIGEMEEIAKTYGDAGLSSKTFEGAAEVYRFVESTPLGKEVVENRTMGTDLEDLVSRLANALRERQA
ncbi:MAG: NAD(P)-dependent oxidoreductase [Nisaea sp.]|uniref:NAD(P)-dependent oxidoreductase n=1 Tax=Nisaea sp. TaxID=2024842 RepID=UPI001B010F8E|nr:NAD(P)-dependent oxidoreductase [Nisaea sp.]MBO6561632.1 NAD(P)-dependent oxidoreductase [Nisaea sp.]